MESCAAWAAWVGGKGLEEWVTSSMSSDSERTSSSQGPECRIQQYAFDREADTYFMHVVQLQWRYHAAIMEADTLCGLRSMTVVQYESEAVSRSAGRALLNATNMNA